MRWEETGEHAERSEDALAKSSKTPEKAEICGRRASRMKDK